jgi:hypothetical protein
VQVRDGEELRRERFSPFVISRSRVQTRPGLQTPAVARSPSALVDECMVLWSLAAAPGSDRVDARALRSGRLEVTLHPKQGDRIDKEEYDKWRRALQAESTDAAQLSR